MSKNSVIIVRRTNRKTPYYTALYKKLRRSKSPIVSLGSNIADKTQHTIALNSEYLAGYNPFYDKIQLGNPHLKPDNLIIPEITFRRHSNSVVKNVDYLKLLLNFLEHETLHQTIDKLIDIDTGGKLDNTSLEYQQITEYWLTDSVEL